MEIATLRDWIIVIFGCLGIVTILMVMAMLFLIYRKIMAILNSAKQAVDNVRETSALLSNAIIKPIAKVLDFITGARKAAEFVSSMSKGREKDGR